MLRTDGMHDEKHTFDETSNFSYLEHIPDEKEHHVVRDHDFIRHPTRQIHAGFVQRDRSEAVRFHDSIKPAMDNLVPVAMDLPQGVHTNNAGHIHEVAGRHDHGPLLPIRVAAHDSEIALPHFTHQMYSIENKGASEPTIMLTGLREMKMPMPGGGPLTSRFPHRMEESMSIVIPTDSQMEYRPHGVLYHNNEQHHYLGVSEPRPDNRHTLDFDRFEAFAPRKNHNMFDTYQPNQLSDDNLEVQEPDDWL